MTPFRASALGLWASLLVAPVGAQEVPVTSLSQPDRVTERGFTNLVGIKELRNGRVILVDEIERLILLLDAQLANGKPIGKEGSGPGEYVVPSRLFSLVGDSSAVLDDPNSRLLVLSPDGEPVGVLNFLPSVGRLTASDVQGRFYSSWAGEIRRWSPSSSVLDTIATYPVTDSRAGGMSSRSPRDTNPFPAQAQWAAAADGRIAIVHANPYHVEMIAVDGVRQEGSEVPFEKQKVTDGHKEQWRKDRSRPRTVPVIMRDGSPTSFMTLPGNMSEPARWPEYLPPFLRDAATFAPDGRLWVQRTTPADGPPTFDVFDSEAHRVEQVTLPQGRRLIGFGRSSVYVVVRDGLDLEYLERYGLEGIG